MHVFFARANRLAGLWPILQAVVHMGLSEADESNMSTQDVNAQQEQTYEGIGVRQSLLLMIGTAVVLEFLIMAILPFVVPDWAPWWIEALADAGSLGVSLSLVTYMVLIHPLEHKLQQYYDMSSLFAGDISYLTGNAFHDRLIEIVTEAFDASFVLVGEVVEDGAAARVIKGYAQGDDPIVDQYDLAGTPCQPVTKGRELVIDHGVKEHYPDDAMLQALDVQGYIGIPLKDKNGKVIGVLAILTRSRIDEPKMALSIAKIFASRAGAELVHLIEQRDNEKLYRRKAAIERVVNESMIVSITDVRGNIVFANDKFCEVTGYALTEVLGRNHRIVNSGVHEKSMWTDMYKTASEGGIWVGNVRNKAKDGSFYDVYSAITAICDETGKVDEYISVRFDITELRKSQQKAERLMESMNVMDGGMLLADCQGQVEYANSAMCSMLGHGQNCDQSKATITDAVQDQKSKAILLKALQEGSTASLTVPIQRLGDGTQGTGRLELTPLYDTKDDSLRGYAMTCFDITDQLDHEEVLRIKSALGELVRVYQPILGQDDILIDFRLEEILEYICHAHDIGFAGRASVYIQEADSLRLAASVEPGEDDDFEFDEEDLRDCVVPLTHQGEFLGEITISVVDNPTTEEEIDQFVRQFAEQVSMAIASQRLVWREKELESEQASQVYAMGKEMRIPMTSIVGAAEILDEPDIDPYERKELTLMIRRNADYLIAAVDNMLDLAGATVSKMFEMPDDNSQTDKPLEDVRVLVVEPLNGERDHVVSALRDAKAVVEVSRSPEQAIHLALSAWRAQRTHAVLVLDIECGETEVDLLPRLLREAYYPSPIVVIGHDPESVVLKERYDAAGCDLFLSGPIDGEELVEMIIEIVREWKQPDVKAA